MSLAPLIEVDASRCVNCHKCIAVCPVKYCNDGSGDHVSIDHERCIGCGSCLSACAHDARRPIDDTARFLADLAAGLPMIAIAAPAVAVSFPGRYLQLNGWLRSRGVAAVFDVSFGAELTVKTYLDHLERAKPRTIIAQPCPAIVGYIEAYRPELLGALAPADSPMVHTMKMIRRWQPRFGGHRIVVLSPCIAKKREFEATGFGDYNVTFRALAEHFEQTGVDLSRFPAADYDNPPAERAVLFSTPGGLMRTAQRTRPEIPNVTRKIEGNPTIYHYLDGLSNAIATGTAPVLVDCLNCERGCNGGPGTLKQHAHVDEIESLVERRSREAQARWAAAGEPVDPAAGRTALDTAIDEHWEPGLYGRRYQDRSQATRLREPARADFDRIYRAMGKESRADFLNCASCGYGTCEGMARAIFNGLNRPENCHTYREMQVKRLQVRDDEVKSIRQNSEVLAEAAVRLESIGEVLAGNADRTTARADAVSAAARQVADDVTTVASGIEQLGASIHDIAASAQQATGFAETAVRVTDQANGAVEQLRASSEEIGKVIRLIRSIAFQTNVLSLNASIEAARAGDAGLGFAVVASAVKELSARITAATEEIGAKIGAIQQQTQGTVAGLGEVAAVIREILEHQQRIAAATEEQAATSRLIGERAAGASTGTGAIVSHLGEVVGEMRETRQKVGDVQSATGELAAMAEELESIVARFG